MYICRWQSTSEYVVIAVFRNRMQESSSDAVQSATIIGIPAS